MISIFTPTFNRRKLLSVLKDSIDEQNCTDFEWIIVDDGSVDGTREMVEEWLKQKPAYHLIYQYQENQGKHIAFNTAVRISKGEWIICVDSDDYLSKDAVTTMYSDIEKVDGDSIGIVYPKNLEGLSDEDKWRKIDQKKVDIMDLKTVFDIPESAILMRRKNIVNLSFPQIEKEKFIPEGWLYQKLINQGKFKAHNSTFYYGAYQPEGLTSNVWKLWANNATGVLMVLREKYRLMNKYPFSTRMIGKIKCLINLNTICLRSGKPIRSESPAPILSGALFLPSIYFYQKRFGKK